MSVKIETAETAVLRAVLDENLEDAEVRLADFLNGELTEFYGQVSQLIDLITAETRCRGIRT